MKIRMQNINGILAIVAPPLTSKQPETSLLRRNLRFMDGNLVPAICVDWGNVQCFNFEFTDIRPRDLAFYSLSKRVQLMGTRACLTPQFLSESLRLLGYADECRLVLTPHTDIDSEVLDQIGFEGTEKNVRYALAVPHAVGISKRNPMVNQIAPNAYSASLFR